MNYKLYLIESGLFGGIKRIIYVENNDEVFEYFSPSNISKVGENFYNTRLYTDCEPFATLDDRKDLFDLIYYLTCDTSSKRDRCEIHCYKIKDIYIY